MSGRPPRLPGGEGDGKALPGLTGRCRPPTPLGGTTCPSRACWCQFPGGGGVGVEASERHWSVYTQLLAV